MAYGPQPVVVHPSVATPTAHVPFSQAHQPHAQVRISLLLLRLVDQSF